MAGRVELKPDADDGDAVAGGSGAGGSPGASGSVQFEVDPKGNAVLEVRGDRVTSHSLRDGSRQATFRDPVVSATRIQPPAGPAPASPRDDSENRRPGSSGSMPSPPSSGGGGGGGSRIIGHYWRPN